MKKYFLLLILVFCSSLIACGGAEDKKADYFQKAEQWFDEGNYEKARVELQNVLQIDPKDVPARFLLAQVLEKTQEFRAAASQYNAIIEQDETHVESRVRLGQFYLIARNIEKAKEQAEKALELSPDNADVLAFRASIFLREGNSGQAMRDVVRALESEPGNVNATLLKATLLNRSGKTSDAIAVLTQGISDKPDNVLFRNTLATIYLAAGEQNKAVEVIEALSDMQPKILFHRMRLAEILYAANRKDEAEDTLRKAIVDFPESDQVKLALVNYLAKEKGNDAAVGELQKLVKQNEENFTLKYSLARLHLDSGESEKAIDLYQNIINKEALNPEGLNSRVYLAGLYVNIGRVAEARTLLQQVLTESPNSQQALALRGQIALSENDSLSAINDFRAAMRDQPNSIPLHRNLARAHIMNGETDLAIDIMKRALKISSQDLSLYQDYIRLLAVKGDTDQVVEQLDKVLELAPDNLGAMEALFNVHAARKDWDALNKLTDKMKFTHPDKAVSWYFAGLVQQAQNNLPQSIREFEQAVELAPETVEPITQLVRIDLAMKKPDEALLRLEKLLTDNEQNIFARNLKGEVLLYEQKPELAKAEFEKVIELKPDWHLPYRNLARVHLANGDRDKIVETYQSGIQASNYSPLLVTDLARYYEATNKVDEAIGLYEQVLLKDNTNTLASNNLSMLLIDYKGDADSLQRAEALVENLKDIDNPAYLDTIGWLYYHQGRFDEAIPLLQKAVDSSPENPGLNYHLGMAYFRSGNTEGAGKALTIATQSEQNYLGMEEAREALNKLNL